MIRALYNKDTGEIVKKQYPRKDGKPIVGLDKKLEWLEIETETRPTYNPLQYECESVLNIVDGVCIEGFELVEFSEAQIISKLNNEVGNHIDSNYPYWEQNKHSGRALRALNKMVSGGTLTPDEQTYINYVQACADWAAECRALRDEYEEIYTTTGNLPQVIFPAKPEKL